MASSRYIISLDLHTTYSQITLPVTAGDTDREFLISFSDGDRPYILKEGYYATISFEYPNGVAVQRICATSDDGSYVIYEFDQEASPCPLAGLYDVQVIVYGNGRKIAAPRFSVDAAGVINTDDNTEIPEGDRVILDQIYLAESQRVKNESERREAELSRELAEDARQRNTQAAIESMNAFKQELKDAKESGELDGKDGEDGKDGADGVSPIISTAVVNGGYEVYIKDKEGEHRFTILHGKNGEKGAAGVSAYHYWNGTSLTITSAAGTSTADLKGDKGDKGEQGDGLNIVKTYSSVAEMLTNAANDGVEIGKCVIIDTGDVNNEDNAKVYAKTVNGYKFICDLSGAQGIKGEPGYTPVRGVDYFTPSDKGEIVNMVLDALPNGDLEEY